MRRATMLASLILILAAVVSGCSQERAWPTDKRPLQVIPDMETQEKFKPQGQTGLFADGRMMRMPPPGTIARGHLKTNAVLYTGKVNGTLVTHGPLPVSMEFMERGRGRFNIYCSPCHDQTGAGRGVVVTRGGLVPPPSFHDERLLGEPDGHFFDVMTNGIRTMPAYRGQITPEDRWAIVAYIRALQRSQNATLADVPVDRRGEVK